jgi:hypothetical protein
VDIIAYATHAFAWHHPTAVHLKRARNVSKAGFFTCQRHCTGLRWETCGGARAMH